MPNMAAGWGGAVERLFHRLPSALDLRDEVQLESMLELSDRLIARVERQEDLTALEALIESSPENWPTGARVIVKLARSKAMIGRRRVPLRLNVVVPLFSEHQRIMRPFESPVGEAFLDRKIRELHWLSESSARVSWELTLVDDGCPHQSGRMAEEILACRHPEAPARVLYLDQAVKVQHPAVEGLRSSRESQKGGAVHFGLWEAALKKSNVGGDYVVAFADADLSTHLGQLGLLVEALDTPWIRVATGTRRAATSAVVKSNRRSARGRLFIYLWKKLLPELAYLDDTQCGFKAMRAHQVHALIRSATERSFAFDLELLLHAELLSPRSVASVPIAWIDSEASSNTQEASAHLKMLQRVVRLSRRPNRRDAISEAYAQAIEGLDETSWRAAISSFGETLESMDPRLDNENTLVTPASLMAL